jgi:hypothetical protein
VKIASGIISLLLGCVILFQSCAVAGLGSIVAPESGTGAIGMLLGVLLMISGAFSFQLPKVSTVLCVISALLALMEAANDFGDMKFWAVVCLGLAVMNFFAARKPKESVTTAR